MLHVLSRHFVENGFQESRSSLEFLLLLTQQQINCINMILMVDHPVENGITPEYLKAIKDSVHRQFDGLGELHILTLLLGPMSEEMKELSSTGFMNWCYDTQEKRPVIYEHQIADFYGVKSILDGFSMKESYYQELLQGEKAAKEGTIAENKGKKNLPIMAGMLVGINIIVFLICTLMGDVVYNKGVLYGPAMFEQNEWYRLITSMFLHGDFQHILNNMILLYCIGELIEKRLGHLSFLVLYFISGIGGGLLSASIAYADGLQVASLGASGAVFGLMGVLLALVLFNRGRMGTVTLPRLLLMLAFSVYSGFTGGNIDNVAHIGGLLVGFLVSSPYIFVIRKAEQKR